MSGIYHLDLEDKGQDLLWLECNAEDGIVTDCSPSFQRIYVGKCRVVISELLTDRAVHLSRNSGPVDTLQYLMVRVSLDGKILREAQVAA